jgi:hypothetical protein
MDVATSVATRAMALWMVERVACPWYSCGIARVRVSTTVDGGLLKRAREVRLGLADSALLDEALTALVASRRTAEIDAAYAAYDDHPLDEADGWGDLASFRAAAGES